MMNPIQIKICGVTNANDTRACVELGADMIGFNFYPASPRYIEPVMIRRQNRDVAVLLSPHEYDRLRALNTEEVQRFCDRISERTADRGLTEDKLAEILGDEC